MVQVAVSKSDTVCARFADVRILFLKAAQYEVVEPRTTAGHQSSAPSQWTSPGEEQKASTQRHAFTRRDQRLGREHRGSVNLKPHQILSHPSQTYPPRCD